MSPETLRGRTLKIGERLRATPTVKQAAAAFSITVTTDSTFIRGRDDGERQLEVRVGNVETAAGGRQVFGAVARSDTNVAVLICRSLDAVGRTGRSTVTAFTDGCAGLQSILADAGVTQKPIANWFPIVMRLQHAKLAASGLSTDAPGRMAAKTAIVAEVERLHWCIWNGKAKEETDRQHIRLATLRDAYDRLSNFIASLLICPLYSFDPEVLYGGVDGLKFASAEPTTKARCSRKYCGRGVVAYTLLTNHVPLETDLIGANEHESHYVFDICYHNISDMVLTAITGNMHSVNKANLTVLHWFGLKFAPRFTSLRAQLPRPYCASDVAQYDSCQLPPAGQIDRCVIAAGKENIHRIVITLGLKEMSQSTPVRKLSHLLILRPQWR